MGFGAISEVILSAPWRSNTSLEGIFKSSHTQILEFWSQNQFFPLGSFEDAHVPERRILPQFPNKAFSTNVLKTKVAPNDKKNMLGTIMEVIVILPYHPQLQEEHNDPCVLDKVNNIIEGRVENKSCSK